MKNPQNARFEIKVRRNRAVVEAHYLSDYQAAMDLLDHLEAKYAGVCAIEFKDRLAWRRA